MTLVSLESTMRGERVALEVGADELFVGVAEDALQRAFGGGLQGGVDGLTVMGFSATKVRSTSETFGVGTRIAKPSSLPSISG